LPAAKNLGYWFSVPDLPPATYNLPPLRREIHAAQEVLEARVGPSVTSRHQAPKVKDYGTIGLLAGTGAPVT